MKKGNVTAGALLTDVNATYVTREYQICFKCHSNYGYNTPMNVGYTAGLTPYNTNGMTQYTSNAREFNAPDAYLGDGQNAGFESGAYGTDFYCKDFAPVMCNLNKSNRRSWHPVTKRTGRTKAVRAITLAGVWNPPWDDHVGNQTMYCSDCHGQRTGLDTLDPDGQGTVNGVAWGPHGSEYPFILKGKYDQHTGTPCTAALANCTQPDRGDQRNEDLCFKCHNYDNYANPNGIGDSGFSMPNKGNLHTKHGSRLKRMKCMWCHISTPHGWKNRNFLVNLNDIGPEVCTPTCPPGYEGVVNRGFEHQLQNAGGITQPLFLGPYYYNAINKLINFATSGQWDPKNCGSKNANLAMVGQATDWGEGTGQQWMTGTCNNLP